MPNKYTLSVSDDQNIDITLDQQATGYIATFKDTESLYAFARFMESNLGGQIGSLCDTAINNHMDFPVQFPTLSLEAPKQIVNQILPLLTPVEINEEFKAEASEADLNLSELSLSEIFNAASSAAPASTLHNVSNNAIIAEKAAPESTEKEIHHFELNLDESKKMEFLATVANNAYSLTFEDMDQAFAFNEWISNIQMSLQEMISYQANNAVAGQKFTFAITANQFNKIKNAVTENQAIFGGSAPTVEVHQNAEEKHNAVVASIDSAPVTVHNEDSDSDFEMEEDKVIPTETASLLGESLSNMFRGGAAAAQAVQSAASNLLRRDSAENADDFVEVEMQEMQEMTSKNKM